jgi:signal peptidase I
VGDSLDLDLRRDLDPGPAGASQPSWIRELLTSWLPAILAVFVLRSIVVEPFQIPSGSMVPTLAIGDFIAVSKFSYGLRVPFTDVEILPLDEPSRGDIVVFIHPPTQSHDPYCFPKRMLTFWSGGLLGEQTEACTTDYIKRIVGLPGDTVELRDNVVFLNGVEQPRTPEPDTTYTSDDCNMRPMKQFTEVLDGRPHVVLQSEGYGMAMRPDMPPTAVPQGNYFVMGDNRDHSADSRVWRFVPRENIKGKATYVWLSFDGCHGNIPVLGRLRTERLGTSLR